METGLVSGNAFLGILHFGFFNHCLTQFHIRLGYDGINLLHPVNRLGHNLHSADLLCFSQSFRRFLHIALAFGICRRTNRLFFHQINLFRRVLMRGIVSHIAKVVMAQPPLFQICFMPRHKLLLAFGQFDSHILPFNQIRINRLMYFQIRKRILLQIISQFFRAAAVNHTIFSRNRISSVLIRLQARQHFCSQKLIIISLQPCNTDRLHNTVRINGIIHHNTVHRNIANI